VRYVQHAALRPHHCAVIPFIGNTNGRGFIDTGIDLPGWDPHVYVSVEAVEEMAREIGWQPAHISAQAATRAGEKDARIAELEAEVADKTERLEAVQVLRSAGYTSARKPGRKSKAVA
jgi:hypothetical protein